MCRREAKGRLNKPQQVNGYKTMLEDVPPPRKQIMCLQIFIKRKKKKKVRQNSDFPHHRKKAQRGKRHYRCCNTYSLNKGDLFSLATAEEQDHKSNSTFACIFVPLRGYSEPSDRKSTALSTANKNSPPPNSFGLRRP